MAAKRRTAQDRPPIDPGMQPERTAMAWERTGFSLVVAGAVVARYGYVDGFFWETLAGSLVVIGGSVSTLWAAYHYHDADNPLRSNRSPVQPLATRMVGFSAILASGGALMMAVRIVVQRYDLL